MSSTAKTSTSDKVDVSFATDDEDESSSSSAEESGDETPSSESGGDEKQSDGDGDADDESDMPTFTLSLQPSTWANDADDSLPDLTRSSATVSKQETQQETVVKMTGSLSETETRIVTTTTRSTSSRTEVGDVVPDVAKETPSTVPAKEEVEEESSEELEESEESEEEEEEEEESEEEEEKHKEQSLPSSSVAASSSSPVSTKIDTKEDLTITSSKLPVTELKIQVKEVKEEHAAVAVVETKTMINADKTTKMNDSSVTEVKDKHTSATKAEEKSSIKETIVTEQAASRKIDAKENMLDSSKTAAAAESKITNDVKAASTSSISNPDHQPSKKNKKESANTEAKSESTKSTSLSASVTEADDLKHKDGEKETSKSSEEKAAKVSAIEKTVTKLSKTSEGDETKAKDEGKTADNPKSGKSRKTKVDAKEIKQEVTETVEEDQTASIVVVIEQNTDKLKPEKVKASKTTADANPKAKVDPQKTTEVYKQRKIDSVPEATIVQTTDKPESEELITDVTNSISQRTKNKADEVAVHRSATAVANEEESITETDKSEEQLPSKKKAKRSTVDNKESEVINVAADSSAVANDLEHNVRKSRNILEHKVAEKSDDISSAVAASETDTSKSPVTVVESELEKNVTDTQKLKYSTIESEVTSVAVDSSTVANDLEHGDRKSGNILEHNVAEKSCDISSTVTESEDKSHPAANIGDKDRKLNGVEDEGKLLAGDDAEFRPRRNSIDEFIKRILAEAREEQKKILDSCAVPSSGETTSEISTSTSIKVADGVPSSKGTELDLQQQQPIVNGVDVGLTTRPARRNREDFDIDDELADISRYLAKRTLVDHVSTADEESVEFGSITQADDSTKSKIVANGDERLLPMSNDEVLHFVPQRRESTAAMVRDSSRPVRVLVDQQTSVIRQLTEASRAIDELDNEIRQLRQSTGGREALYASIGTAIRDELRIYEMELTAAGERLSQQRLPGGGRFIREQFVSQCAAELLQRSAVTNGPRLDRAANVDEWTRIGRRRSGSFSAPVDEDVGGSSRTGARPWLPTAVDRDTTDLMIQYRHSRSGSVVSDRGYSSVDTADESRATTSSLLSRLTAFNGSTKATELDFGRNSRASSEAPRPSYPRLQTTSDDWLSTNNSTYSVGRQYVGYSFDSAEDSNGDLDIGYRVSAVRPVAQLSYRRYQPPSIDTTTTPHSRLYVRRGSLQSNSTYDGGSGGNDVGPSFNSRFLSRVREKKALGETTSRQTTSDRPFRSRFLKSSSTTGSTSTTYSSSRSAAQYESDDN